MANFEIQVEPGQEVEALQQFFVETMCFLRELAKIGDTPWGQLLFVPIPYKLCCSSLNNFGLYEERAFFALRRIKKKHIRNHALEGAHLKSKLGIIAFYHREFQDVQFEFQGPVDASNVGSEEAQRLGWGARKLLKKLLASIDTLLESLLDGVGAGGAIIELKKQFETAIAD